MSQDSKVWHCSCGFYSEDPVSKTEHDIKIAHLEANDKYRPNAIKHEWLDDTSKQEVEPSKLWECKCGFVTREIRCKIEHQVNNEFNIGHIWVEEQEWVQEPTKQETIRNPVGVRYDILYPPFEEMLAKIAHYGAETYGDLNWQKSRLEGGKGPINHIHKHLNTYQQGKPYDHAELGTHRKVHLAAIAFNAMMEFWYEEQEEQKKGKSS